MRRAALTLALLLAALRAAATGFTDIGQDIARRSDWGVSLDGYLRVRPEALYNLDLDRGLDPSGRPLFPVPLSDPTAQLMTHADMRLRTDLARFVAEERP